jgi:hypothetical protein
MLPSVPNAVILANGIVPGVIGADTKLESLLGVRSANIPVANEAKFAYALPVPPSVVGNGDVKTILGVTIPDGVIVVVSTPSVRIITTPESPPCIAMLFVNAGFWSTI